MDPLLAGYLGLSQDINKANSTNTAENAEGAISDLTDELKLSMSDEELIELKQDWETTWEPYAKALAVSQNDNENYWLGKQYDSSTKPDGHALVDNLIFTALETFLPIATRPKADPVVNGDNTQQGELLADKVRKMLQYWATDNAYNLRLKDVTRWWSLFKLGCMKLGWSNQDNDITCVAIRPQKLILDPDSRIDCGEYTGEYIGEYRKESARNLIARFPKSKEYITEQCNGKMGTKMQYIEWWTNDYVFWTMNDQVLAKAKNPHWNYDKTQTSVNEMGETNSQDVSGRNHFTYPKKPYAFLSIFSLGLRPYDDTNLIQQSLPLQDLINKRLRQIDKNADKTNGGLAVSGDSFTKEQASGVGKSTEKGGTIFVPNGKIGDAVGRLSAPALPEFVYQSLIDYRNELQNIFGTRGSAPQGTIGEKTVRGKMMIKGQDGDRIGGGISTYLEQFSDVVYNYVVQMMYVYYDQAHVATIIGKDRSAEYISLRSQDLVCKLSVTVKDGSMIPKDPVTEREEAINLWSQGGLDPITFFEKLDFPDPKQSAEQLYMWKADPALLFPDVAKQMQPKAPPSKAPAEMIAYKDAPADIKRQMEKQAGMQPSQIQEPDATQLETQKMAFQQKHDELQQTSQQIHEIKMAREKGAIDHHKIQREALHTSAQAHEQSLHNQIENEQKAKIAQESAEQALKANPQSNAV